MYTTFTAKKEVMRDYYPPGVIKAGHVDGPECPCNPFESMSNLHKIIDNDKDKNVIGVIIQVVITHRPIPEKEIITPIVRMPVFCDDKLSPGARDTVSGLKNRRRLSRIRE